ncbi:MAG TPA: hypothetical protein VIM68_01415, partial [Thermoanaerobaculia bacterium]
MPFFGAATSTPDRISERYRTSKTHAGDMDPLFVRALICPGDVNIAACPGHSRKTGGTRDTGRCDFDARG